MKNLLILKILEQYSDEKNPLTYQKIINRMEDDFNETCDRRTVANHIKTLQNFGYDIIKSNRGFYIEREFEDSELRLLIDSVLFSKNISRNQAKRIIDKLKNLGGKRFNFKVPHVFNLTSLRYSENKDIMRTVDAINDAINLRKKILFTYNKFVREKNFFKLTPQKIFQASPYQMVTANGFYYLIANADGCENLAHYRIDKMTDVKIISEGIAPRRYVKEIACGGLNLPQHLAEHIYMFNGESIWAKFWISEKIIDAFVDGFGTGKDFKILRETAEKFLIEVKVNFDAMKFWAMQFGENIEIISPTKLREEIKSAAEKILLNHSAK